MSDITQPRPNPLQLPPPVGVYGSLERIIMEAPGIAAALPKYDDPFMGQKPSVWLFERPEQVKLYPVVVIKSGKASVLDETFEGYKLKEFPATIEVFGNTDSEVVSICRMIEKALEDPDAPLRIAMWTGATRTEDDCGVYLQDEGEDFDREYHRYSPQGGRPVVCRWPWRIGVKYLSSPRRAESPGGLDGS